jgi:hypothetical protein
MQRTKNVLFAGNVLRSFLHKQLPLPFVVDAVCQNKPSPENAVLPGSLTKSFNRYSYEY